MTSYECVSAPRAVNVLASRAARRLTRRDGLLPVLLALELLAGVAFGLAGYAGSSAATAVPARLTLGSAPLVTVQPALQPMASVTASTSVGLPTVGPGIPAAQVPAGPAVGPLLPGTVRGALPVTMAPAARPVEVVTPTTTPPRHAPRDPFAALVTVRR